MSGLSGPAGRDPVRTVVFLAPAVVAAVLLPLLVRTGIRTITNSTQGRQVTVHDDSASGAVAGTVTRLPPTPAALIVVDDTEGRPVTSGLIAVDPSGKGGTLVVVPVGLQSSTGARLDASYAAGGLSGLSHEVERTFGITLAATTELRPGDLAGVLAPFSPIAVTFDDPVRDTGGSVVEPAGTANLDAPAIAAVLAAHADGESELARLSRVEAVWRSLLVRPSPSVPTGPLAPGVVTVDGPQVATGTQALGALLAGDATVVGVAVDDTTVDDSGAEVVVPDKAALRSLMAHILPGAISTLDASVRLRIENPLGDPSLSLAAVRILLPLGASIALVDDTAGTAPPASRVEAGSGDLVDALGAIASAFGAGTVVVSSAPIDGVDGTVTLGKSFPSIAAATAGSQPSATSSVPQTSPASSGPTTT